MLLALGGPRRRGVRIVLSDAVELLSIEDLRTTFPAADHIVAAVDGVTL